MSEHTPTPWMTNRAGEMLPDDWMIVADMGKTPNGIQQISTVARALSIRQTPETTAANAAFIVQAVNAHDEAIGFLELASISLWRAGDNAAAREIDKFLDRVSPSSRESINARLGTGTDLIATPNT